MYWRTSTSSNFDAHMPDMLSIISQRYITLSGLVSCRLGFSLRFFSTQKMTDNAGHRESKIYLWIWESCCSTPLCPHCHPLPLPNQFCAGTLLTQVKGLWYSSQFLCLHTTQIAGQRRRHIDAPLFLGFGDRICVHVALMRGISEITSSKNTHGCICV